LIRGYIGTGSKLIFLDGNNKPTIINEKAGHWSDKNWFSNYSYISYKYPKYGNYGSYGTKKKSQSYYDKLEADWYSEAESPAKGSYSKLPNYINTAFLTLAQVQDLQEIHDLFPEYTREYYEEYVVANGYGIS